MGLAAFTKVEFIKVFLKKLTDGDTGSTLLGALAAAVLAVPNLADLFSSEQSKQAHEGGLLAGALFVAAWGYYIGKKKVPGK